MPKGTDIQGNDRKKYQKLYNWGRTLITSGVTSSPPKIFCKRNLDIPDRRCGQHWPSWKKKD